MNRELTLEGTEEVENTLTEDAENMETEDTEDTD